MRDRASQSRGTERVPLRELRLTAAEGQVQTWRETVFLLAGAVLEAAKALHRIADQMERRDG